MWIGLKTIREARQTFEAKAVTTGAARAFREGIVVEALNPKTAAFFLAFLPQFVDPSAGPVWLQFLVLGLISVALNPAVDVLVALLASPARSLATARPTRPGAPLRAAACNAELATDPSQRPGMTRAARQSSKIATARVQPAEAPRILCGKQAMVKPSPGKTSRLCSFSRWQ